METDGPAEPRTRHPLDEHQLGFSTMLTVRDIAASEAFYVDLLGFQVAERRDRTAITRAVPVDGNGSLVGRFSLRPPIQRRMLEAIAAGYVPAHLSQPRGRSRSIVLAGVR
jgi:catechol 2,3-dioxygenase-like lactoylglutathione lyase family enzyme